jgi:hypothetical protein
MADSSEVRNMDTFTLSSGLMLLWREAATKLMPNELKWLSSGIADYIEEEAGSMSIVLMGLGVQIGSDESEGSFERADVSALLFHVSHQLDHIKGLAHIADDAAFLARQAIEAGNPQA